ncbi:putative beta-neurotoxin RjAa12f [Centruroides sculpturatus]|uniref:putative beta-neurotoxin RjAa12f n=1 Tax=Centruroides sculpturatus TaxID=218467 RepID=UPI000C6CF323|nr:putative beta-neurotoxin RjAa12f [Centruroides sculpturatus]
MKILILIIAFVLLIGVECKDGYPMDSKGCKISCVINDKLCDIECTLRGASSGSCYSWGLACWCKGLPENAEVWDSDTNKCGGK